MLNANVYRGTTGISLLSGMAALGLFLALLGSRVMLAAVKGGYELVTNGVEFEGAYRAKDKDLLRALARDLEQKDPWVLLSRPMKEADGFVEQSLSERASERRARKVSYILLVVALLSGVLFLLAGAGWEQSGGCHGRCAVHGRTAFFYPDRGRCLATAAACGCGCGRSRARLAGH